MKNVVLYSVGFLVLVAFTQNLQASDLLKVTVVNSSDEYSDDQVYVQIVGTDPNGSGKLGHIDLGTSTWQEISEADNTVTPTGGPWADKYTNYAKKLTELTSEGSHSWSFNMPHIISGRVYISFEHPAYFHVNAGPALEFPSAVDSSLPNYLIVFDKVELDWENGRDPFLNTTTVDFFSISFMLKLKLSDGTTEKRGFTKTRKTIVDDLTSLPSIWQNGVVKDGSKVVRFIAPQNLPTNPFANYFDSYVNESWSYYETDKLTLHNLPDVAQWSATGQVIGDVFTFTVAGAGGETVTINNLVGQSAHIFGCDGAGYLQTSGSDSIAKQGIIRQMGAALNRSVLYNIKDATTWWNDSGKFYTQAITNHYSKVLHDASYQGYCYGFPYDDVGDFSSGISGDATEAFITIQSMSERFPIDLTPNENSFSKTGTISVAADVEQISTRFYPAIWIEMEDGRKLYYERGKGFSTSPRPYLSGGPFVLNRTISNYPILNASFTVPAGIYYLNGAAIDATQTTSVNNIVYIDGVDREELTVQ